MEIKKRDMERKDWKRALEREYIATKLEEDNIQGIASLIFIKKVLNPSFKEYESNIKIKIVDDGFYWLQIAIENENYWITAMYDENKKIVQYYIDITEKNEVNVNGESFFLDLFLDVVVLNTGEIILLDEKELKEAKKKNIITKEQYELAYNNANYIIDLISKEKNILNNLCNKYFNILEAKLKSDK